LDGLVGELVDIGGAAKGSLSRGAVIPEIDIWRAAQLMLKRYGERALEESAARADELALAGDDDGAVTWRRIMAAITQRANDPARPGALSCPIWGRSPPMLLYVMIRFIACISKAKRAPVKSALFLMVTRF
jgi:hypothetical protein